MSSEVAFARAIPARLGSGVSPVLRNQEQSLGEQAEFTGPVAATVETMSVPPSVLDAFGTSAPASRLQGGEGTTFRSGDVVLKPAARADEAQWVAHVYNTLEPRGFVVPRPIASRDGGWVYGGWTAWQYLEGETVEGGRYAERLEASRAFHRALAGYERPDLLDARDDPWAQADRVVWEGRPWQPHARVAEVYARLNRLVKPLTLEEQIIHGDVTGNMLAVPGGSLAVIDFSPYWRPAAFAEAVFVIDAVMWEGAPWDVARSAGSGEAFAQLLVRAAMRRLAEVDRHYRLRGLPESHLGQVNKFADVALELERLLPEAATSGS